MLESADPFAAAMGPIERYESLYMGADEFLNRRVNEELQRAFEAGIPSSSEGFRSAVSHELHRFLLIQHHLQFRLDLRLQSASAAPARLVSSPRGMSDIAGTLTPPGLPLRDPPRVTGSYGIPLSDAVFGSSSRSFPCKNPGQRPMPPPAPLQPAESAGSAGVQDPSAQIMQSQSAMRCL